MVETREEIYRVSFDVSRALRSLQNLETQLIKIEQIGTRLKKGKTLSPDIVGPGIDQIASKHKALSAALRSTTDAVLRDRARLEKALRSYTPYAPSVSKTTGAPTTVSDRVRRAVLQEKSAREALNASLKRYRAGVRIAERTGVSAARNIERAVKADERATLRATKAMEKSAAAAVRSRNQFRRTFLSIGRDSRSGLGSIARNAAAAAVAMVGLHRVLRKVGEAKDRYMRFDELTTAAMTITHAGEEAYEVGSLGAERYRDSIREAANDVKAASADMASSALFWAKAGQTNTETIAELSKIGTMFARANRDAANNTLEQTRANDILSDALTLFRSDTSTTDKAVAAATLLSDKLTGAANASNIVVEQLFEYSKKVAALFKAGDVSNDEILAIASSLAAAGLKDESGVHVRRIMTQLTRSGVQKMLSDAGIKITDEEGGIRSLGDIFGELQIVLKKQKPLERMSYLKELFGQRAISTAAALAGLNEEGLPGETSIAAITKKIEEAEGISRRNQEQFLKTTSGRVQALTSTWGNALDKMLEDSGIIQKILSGFEGINQIEFFRWMDDTAVPALESFGVTIRDTVIPGVQMAASNISDWFSPAMQVISGLFGGATANAEGFSDTITGLVKLWVKWRIAMLAIRGLRMIDWLANMARQAKVAAVATKAIGDTTVKSVKSAKTAVGGLAGAFTVAGVAITAAIAAWGLYDLLIGPIISAEKRIEKLRVKYGEGLKYLKAGDEDAATLLGRRRDAERSLEVFEERMDPRTKHLPENQRQLNELKAEIARINSVLKSQIEKEYNLNIDTTVEIPGRQSRPEAVYGEQQRQSTPVPVLEERYVTTRVTGTDFELEKAKNALLDGLREQAATQQQIVDKQKLEMVELAHELDNTSSERAALVVDTMSALDSRLKDNNNRLKETADRIGELLDSRREEKTSELAEGLAKAGKDKRDKAFSGGKTEPINPFVLPILSGIDDLGNRIINIAMQKGNAAEYFRKSPEARETLVKEMKSMKNVYNVHFGDTSVSVTARSDANPKQIANAIKKEAYKIGRRNIEDVQRVLGSIAPAEI